MIKLFSTRTHGMLDYVTAAKMIALPRLLSWPDEVRQTLTVAGLGTIGYSLATRYELGVWKVLPMRAHLALDALSGMFFVAAPLAFPRVKPLVKVALIAFGAFEIVAALTTETQPSPAGEVGQLRDYTGDALPRSTEALREREAGA